MLKGLYWVLSDQESQFHSRFHRLCWRLEEQQHGEGAEMSWIQQGHAGLQAKCQQPDGNLLWQGWYGEGPGPDPESSSISRHLGVLSGGRLRGIPESHDPGSSHSSPPNPGVIGCPDCRPPGITPSSSALRNGVLSLSCVLGQQDFVGDCPCWAMKVCLGPDWALGVAWELVSHKGCFGLSPEGAWVWAVGQCWGSFRLSPGPAPCLCPTTTLCLASRGLWITLVGRWLSVMLIVRQVFAFPPPTFPGEWLWPLLLLGEGPALPSVPEFPKNPL
ncbi:uncharacterized protein LOC121363644 isoform X1 [Pyrgilauda ruficollis]|uniref:uncharacterized protein LOC121363644 isoform X1 n=1 Tax=Pyrgilauda ruficollis TaxID=221976 RepID=UPI001B86665A|nr:uncharacterized protein LOC121363644 isoform X1 [Pyrgilauda ruficollis]